MWRLLILSCVALTTQGQLRFFVPQTPCSHIFEYQQFGKRAYKAHLTIQSPAPRTDLEVHVHLYVDALVDENYPGNISLTFGEAENQRRIAAEDIETIEYDVFFPILNPLPEVDRIIVNGDTVCAGPPIRNPASRLHLTHTLVALGRTTTKRPPASNECGLTVSSTPLIVNGTRTSKGDWPWLAAIYEKSENEFTCGGSLVSKKHVITAAHCVKHINDIRQTITRTKDDIAVVLGKYELSNPFESFAVPRDVEAIHIPEDYDPAKYYFHDIALLVLTSPVKFSENIRPICLWTSDQNSDKVINKTGTVVGWGRSEDEIITNTPKMAHVFIVSRDDCIRSNALLRHFTNDRTLCAGFRDGRGPCTGDSGGPMMIPQPETERRVRWYLSGVVSNAIYDNPNDICDVRQYSVYTDVVKYYSWLRTFITRK